MIRRECPDAGTDAARRLAYRDVQDGRNVMIVCTDRMAAEAARQAVEARRIEREAMRTAATSLEQARAGLDHLSFDRRAGVIAGIEKALAGMEARNARRD